MITKVPFNSLGKADYGWLQARYHFSFANYYDAARTGFGTLLVINDDRIAAGHGFDTHPHRDMEIITFVRQGAITHKDSVGNAGVTKAGDVQVMSAGTGIHHSEHNLSDETCILYQMWIEPREEGLAPRWETRQFMKDAAQDALPLLVSGFADDSGKDALYIHQDARIHGGRVHAGVTITHPLSQKAYVLISEGVVLCNNMILESGDGAMVSEVSALTLQALMDAVIIVIQVP